MGTYPDQIKKIGPIKKRIIRDQKSGEPYLIRYSLFKCRLGSVKIHKICMIDNDRHQHDHPWNFYSFILKGGYCEKYTDQNPDPTEPFVVGNRYHKWFSGYYHHAKNFHQIVSTYKNRPVWTFIICGPRRREWGFLRGIHHGYLEWEHWAPYVGIEASKVKYYD